MPTAPGAHPVPSHFGVVRRASLCVFNKTASMPKRIDHELHDTIEPDNEYYAPDWVRQTGC